MEEKEGSAMRILLVDDDRNLSAAIAEKLEKEGYRTDCCYDGETGLHFALNREHNYDIVLLDRMLPILDGLTILRAMRQERIATPVLMMTALGELDDKIDGLDCGADDYLVKPFYIRELLARIRALTRRPGDIRVPKALEAGDLRYDPESRALFRGEASMVLTPREGELLKAFLENPGKPLSRSELLWRVWGGGSEVEGGNVDNYICFLRKRLRELGSRAVLKTVYGTGYCLEENP